MYVCVCVYSMCMVLYMYIMCVSSCAESVYTCVFMYMYVYINMCVSVYSVYIMGNEGQMRHGLRIELKEHVCGVGSLPATLYGFQI